MKLKLIFKNYSKNSFFDFSFQFIVGIRQTLLAHIQDAQIPKKIVATCTRQDLESTSMANLKESSFTATMDLRNKPDPSCLLVASESCVYVESQFRGLYPVLKQLFNFSEQPTKELQDTIEFLYDEVVNVLSFFPVPIYTIVSMKLFRPEISTIIHYEQKLRPIIMELAG